MTQRGRCISNLVSLQVLGATAVPEPGSPALVLSGLAGVAALWRCIMLPAA